MSRNVKQMSNSTSTAFWYAILFMIGCAIAACFANSAHSQTVELSNGLVGSVVSEQNGSVTARTCSHGQTLEPYKSICQIRTSLGQGSGTLIGERPDLGLGLVLSCRHVCEYPRNPLKFDWLWTGGETTQGYTLAVIQGSDFSNDKAVAVCTLPKNVRPLRVVHFSPNSGPWLCAGFRDSLMRVTPKMYQMNAAANGLLIVNTPLIGGMSGGPCLDRYGRIVGVGVASDGRIGVSTNGPELVEFVSRFLRVKTIAELEKGE